MDPVITLDRPELTVEPGGQGSVTVRVHNRGTIVEGYTLDVRGDAAGWTRVLPEELRVYPQEEAEAMVLFTPPLNGGTAAGRVPFGIRATSTVDPSVMATVEGDVTVGQISALLAKAVPATSKGRWSGRHRVEFSNWGNAPVRLAVEAADPDEALGLLVSPTIVDLPVGVTQTVKVKVRPRKPLVRGTPQRRPFRVVGTPIAPGAAAPAPGPPLPAYGADPSRPSAEAAFEQRAVLGRAVIAGVLAAAVGLGALAFLARRGNDAQRDNLTRPPTPAGFDLKAGAVTHESIELVWEPSSVVDTYTLQKLRTDTKDSPSPVPEDETDGIPGSVGGRVLTGLQPATEYCYRLLAVRDDVPSQPTQVRCATTLQESTLPPPGDLAVQQIGATPRARLVWTDQTRGAGTHLVLRDGSTVGGEVAPNVNSTEADLVPGQRNCFQVLSKVGGKTSKPTPITDATCIALAPTTTTTAGPGGAGGPAPVPPVPGPNVGGQGGPTTTAGANTTGPARPANLGIIAVVDTRPLDDSAGGRSPIQFAQEKVDGLRKAGFANAGFLRAGDYPALVPRLKPSTLVVYLSGYQTETAALAECRRIPASLRPVCPFALTPGQPAP
jgi:hypothetical protein